MAEAKSATAMATGLILAGGRGSRMGGADKGLQLLDGKPLAAWVLERLSPQVAEVLINANRNFARYAAFGHRVVPDLDGELAGPLAGLQRGLLESSCDLVVTVPCDAPYFPEDLVRRLTAPLQDKNVDLAVARTGDRVQPVFCMARKNLLPQLTTFIEDGGRKVDAWFETLRTATVDFESERAFANINTPEDLKALEGRQRR